MHIMSTVLTHPALCIYMAWPLYIHTLATVTACPGTNIYLYILATGSTHPDDSICISWARSKHSAHCISILWPLYSIFILWPQYLHILVTFSAYSGHWIFMSWLQYLNILAPVSVYPSYSIFIPGPHELEILFRVFFWHNLIKIPKHPDYVVLTLVSSHRANTSWPLSLHILATVFTHTGLVI